MMAPLNSGRQNQKKAEAGPWISSDGGLINPIIYHDPAIYEREMDAIFGRSWQFVGMASQIEEPGDFFLSRMGADEVLLTRDGNDVVRVMLNVCRHRGHQLCQAERGNTKRFVCPFHGWSFRTDGSLEGVPLGNTLCPDLDKDRFGLVQVPRVEIYRGLVFASFDENAPPVREAMGDLAFYLDTLLGRRADDLVMIGGVHKWKVPANWKIGPDGMGGDFYHTAALHASTFAASTELRDTIKAMGNPDLARNISFAGGHGFNMLLLPETAGNEAMFPVEPRLLEVPEVREYFTAIQPEAVQRLGPLRARMKINTGTMFPNLSYSPGIFTLRLTVPAGPGWIENWCWVLGYADMPPVVRGVLRQAYLSVFGPDGCLEPDDAEAWTLVTEGTGHRRMRDVPLYAGMGLGLEQIHADMPGLHHHPLSEGVSRGFYLQWQSMMHECERS